jgi:hypothetical protein
MSNEVKARSGLDGRRPPVSMSELVGLTRKGKAWNYRAMAAGLIRYITIGDQRYIPPEEADRIEREGVGSLRPTLLPVSRARGSPASTPSPELAPNTTAAADGERRPGCV